MLAVTHSGKFHGDDVVAWALLKLYHPGELRLLRSRNPEDWERADIVFDVGRVFDDSQGRFDHHQHTYTGSLSSAGMVLDFLQERKHIEQDLADHLRRFCINYIDAVDNGKSRSQPDVPCLTSLIERMNRGCRSLEEFTQRFEQTAALVSGFLQAFERELLEHKHAADLIQTAMARAERTGSNVIELGHYCAWKPGYFGNGGADHSTEFVLFQSLQGSWQVVAIPPSEHSFDQKRSLPEEWAGLEGEELSRITGSASVFCHKNRFIAVFETRDAALNALDHVGFLTNPEAHRAD